MNEERMHPNSLIDVYDLAQHEWMAAVRYWNELPKKMAAGDYTSDAWLKALQDAQQVCKEKKARMTWLRNEILQRLDTDPSART